jgi:5-methylcytosine-specific restriction endonuclease McrA
MTSYLRPKADGAKKRSKARKRKRLARTRVCAICGKGLNPDEVSLDHIVPRSRGGVSEAWNLRPAHGKCNWDRGNRMEDSAEVRNATLLHLAFGLRGTPRRGRAAIQLSPPMVPSLKA